MDNSPKEHEYELMRYGREEKSLGTAWWDGKKVKASSASLLAMLKDTTIVAENPLTIKDGVEFLKALPRYYRSYISARKVGE